MQMIIEIDLAAHEPISHVRLISKRAQAYARVRCDQCAG
jgi:hypothetical protein